jgi:hypothetical protein
VTVRTASEVVTAPDVTVSATAASPTPTDVAAFSLLLLLNSSATLELPRLPASALALLDMSPITAMGSSMPAL